MTDPELAPRGRASRWLARLARAPWTALALEVFSVTLSVLAALSIADWRDARAAERRADQALAGIRAELSSNRAQIGARLGYYREMASSVRALADAGTVEIESLAAIPGWRGMAPPLLTSAAYETTIAMQVFADLDFETARGVAFVYSFQSIYGRFFENRILSIEMPASARSLAAMLEDLAGTSAELDRAISELESRLANGTETAPDVVH